MLATVLGGKATMMVSSRVRGHSPGANCFPWTCCRHSARNLRRGEVGSSESPGQGSDRASPGAHSSTAVHTRHLASVCHQKWVCECRSACTAPHPSQPVSFMLMVKQREHSDSEAMCCRRAPRGPQASAAPLSTWMPWQGGWQSDSCALSFTGCQCDEGWTD